MAKKDISKIISSGSPKQRVKLLMEHTALERYGRKGLLTDKETKSLYNSFDSPYEVKLFNKWNKIDRTISLAITNLQGLKFQTMMHYSNLRGYILVWHTMEEAEVLTNSILHEVEQEERIRVAKKGSAEAGVMFSQVNVDDEGYLDLKIDFEKEVYKNGNIDSEKVKTKEFSLRFVMNNVREEAERSVIEFISWRQAIVDFMKDEGFTVKIYKELISDLTDEVYQPIIGWNKYLSDVDSFLMLKGHERLDSLKPFYNTTPNLDQLEVDPDIYNTYLNEYLRG